MCSVYEKGDLFLHAFNPNRNSLFLGKITDFINPDNERVQYIIAEGQSLSKRQSWPCARQEGKQGEWRFNSSHY